MLLVWAIVKGSAFKNTFVTKLQFWDHCILVQWSMRGGNPLRLVMWLDGWNKVEAKAARGSVVKTAQVPGTGDRVICQHGHSERSRTKIMNFVAGRTSLINKIGCRPILFPGNSFPWLPLPFEYFPSLWGGWIQRSNLYYCKFSLL